MTSNPPLVFNTGIAADVFGEYATGRQVNHDKENDFLMSKFLVDYLAWHKKNLRLYDGFEADCGKLKRLYY